VGAGIEPILRIEHLTKVYGGGTRALSDVSFEVARGEFLIIIGLSGSGKSTLLRCINRLIEPTSGKVFFDGREVTGASQQELREIRRKIGMIFQQFNLVKRAPVVTNVLTGRLGYLPPVWSLGNYFPGSLAQAAMANLERCLLYTSPSPRDLSTSRMPSSA